MHLTYPASLASRYDAQRDAILEGLTITREPLGRMCARKIVSQLGEPCETHCVRPARGWNELARARVEELRRLGYEVRCDGICERWCLPRDPKRVAANIAASKAPPVNQPP